jgi:SAM-dependent methyltransferase
MVPREEKGSLPLSLAVFLQSPEAQKIVGDLVDADLREENALSILTKLRCDFSPAEAGALLTLARLRQRARRKFPLAEQMFFVPKALEQATAHVVALHRAEWIHDHAPPGPVLDLGCGIGGDLLALAYYRYVIAYDIDPVRLAFARANAKVLNVADRVEFRLADWTAELAAGRLPNAAAAFADPARRIDGRRVFSLHQMQPPLQTLLALQESIPALGVKVAPGVRDEELPPACSVEFVSHEGVCKEAVLWFGPLAGPHRWASVHHEGQWFQVNEDVDPPPVGELSEGMLLHEPDPAIIRAHALNTLCARLGAHLFDPQIAYLVGMEERTDPLVQSFEIEEIHPFNLKLLNRRLQALELGVVELKKRGTVVEPESLRKRLKLVKGGRAGVIILTRQADRRLMIIGRRFPCTETRA